MPYHFHLDTETISVDLPFDAAILPPPQITALTDPVAALNQALDHPDAGPSFDDYLNGKKDVLVIVSDYTRACGYEQFLSALLDRIERAGFARDQIEIIIALGLHNPQTEQQTRGSLGAAVADRFKDRIVQHLCNSDAELLPLELAPGDTVRVNRRLLDRPHGGERAIILTGTIQFHYHAGFGGGRKAVFPGLTSRSDVMANHRLLMDRNGPRMRNPNCQPGRLENNPIHERMLQVLKCCPPGFLVNSILAPDHGVARFAAGEPVAAHAAGSGFVLNTFSSEIGQSADLVIADAGGWPKDGQLYQAHKAYDSAARAVRKGGAIVFGAGLKEGFGPDAFRKSLQYATLDEHRESLFGDNYTIPSQTCLACREKAERFKTWLVAPRLDPALAQEMRKVGFHLAPDFPTALKESTAFLGTQSPRTLLMPNAAQFMPVVNGKVKEL